MPKKKKSKPAKRIKSGMSTRPVAGVPCLQFTSGGQSQGFNSSALSQFNDINPASAIREFIQNSLDAAAEAGRKVAEIRFLVKKIGCAAVPGLDNYKNALNSAIEAQKRARLFNGQTRQVAEKLLEAVEKQELSVLFVMDNGVGFDKRRLSAIFGDGLSVKDTEASAGAYGNGHLTAFSLSDLQYVFYGGVSQDTSVFGGHAIIASHMGNDNKSRGKDGYFVAGLRDEGLFESDKYDFVADASRIPFIQESVDHIRREYGQGAVVAIPAFNDFKESGKNVADMIVRKAALNFFPAVWGGKLKLSVLVYGEEKQLEKEQLSRILDECKDEKRSGMKGFPSGAVAHRSYETLMQGEQSTLSTPHGDVKIFLRKDEGDKTVALCRNGMWISKDIPQLRQSNFASKQPFDAVVMVDSPDSEAYRLFKAAEGSLHIDISPNRLAGEDRKKVKDCLRAVSEGIKGLVDDKSGKIWKPPDFMAIASGQSVNQSQSNSQSGQRAKPIHRQIIKERTDNKKPRRRVVPTPRPGNALEVKIGSRRIASDKVLVHFLPTKSWDNVEFRMTIDTGADDTCTGQLESVGWEALRLLSVKMDGKDVHVVAGDDGKVAIGGVESGRRHSMEIEYKRPSIAGDYTIQYAFIRRKSAGGGKEVQ